MEDMFAGVSDEELSSRMSELHKEITALRSEINRRKQTAAQVALEHLKEAQAAYAAVIGAPNPNKYPGLYGWRTLQ